MNKENRYTDAVDEILLKLCKVKICICQFKIAKIGKSVIMFYRKVYYQARKEILWQLTITHSGICLLRKA